MAEISVIVPVYGVEPWLRQCVDSILHQSFRDFQLILIDDGSPDGCPEICDDYARKDPRVQVIHRANGGVSAARNAGLELADGRYVTFCDGDDFWAPDHLSGLYRAARETGADLVSCNHTVLSESGELRCCACYSADNRNLETEEDRVDYILRAVLRRKTGWEVWCRLFDLERIRAHGIRFCDGCGYGEDLAFVLEYLLHSCRVCALDQSTYNYRLRSGSAMDTARDQIRLCPLQEAAHHVYRRWKEVLQEERLRQLFPLVHYGILRDEYEKCPAQLLPEHLARIPERAWFFAQVRGLLRLKRECFRYLGSDARRAGAVCRFCLHRCVPVYRLERYLIRRKYGTC